MQKKFSAYYCLKRKNCKNEVEGVVMKNKEKYYEITVTRQKLEKIAENPLFYEILIEIELEFDKASKKYPPFHSMHEGYAVILEELDELKEAIWKSKGVRLNPVAAKEAIQVAAMAVRFILDLEGE